MAENNRRTLIEDGTAIEGNVTSNCPVELCGTVKGHINAPSLSVTQSGSVDGKVKVKELNSKGEISGEINADSVELSGNVKDSTVINAKTLEVKLDQKDGMKVSFGNCRLQVSGDNASNASNQKSESGQQANSGQKQPVHSGGGHHRRR